MNNTLVSDIEENLVFDGIGDLEIDFDGIGEDLLAFQEDEMVQQALHRGVDLKKYGADLEKDLRKAENDSVLQYVENSQQVIDLHRQMQECDGVLARMQEMLLGFQADLSGISEEIKHLQDESLSMSIRLKNRRAAEEKLHKFLENSSLSPELAASIVGPDVTEQFLDAVVCLSSKLRYLSQAKPAEDGSSLDLAPIETYAGRTLLPDLEKLRMRVISKAREYFINQFNAIRKPKTNVQVLQQNALVRYAPLFQFVQLEAQQVAEELRTTYIECMGKTLQNVFKNYSSGLGKFESVIASKNDLIAVEEATLKSMFTQKVVSKRNDSFSLGERDKILDQIESEPVLLHVAAAESAKFPYEVILRSIMKHLCDAATNEFLFVIDFFKVNTRDTFNKIFGRTLSLILENLENYLLNCYDAVGILLMIKINQSLRMVMQRRRIPILDSLFDRISLLLWPRFKFVLDANFKSIKTANPKKLGTIDLTTHYVSRRYAEIVASILSLQWGSGASNDNMGIASGGDNMLQNDLQQMRIEMISLLERLASSLNSNKEKKVFTINNYDQILNVFQERRIVCEEVQKFDDLLMQQRELFAEEEIRAFFPRLISFVVQTEQAMAEHIAAGNSVALVLDDAIVESLVREFSANWRTGIQQINDDVLSYFANFRNGMEILKQVLTQLLLYYTRFQDIIKKSWIRPPAFCRDIVSTATILMEIKKIVRTF